jgi:hypothetical protein
METMIYNHWIEGTKENKEMLISLSRQALVSGKATGEFILREPFKNIFNEASDQTTYTHAVNNELDKLASFRKSILGQPFTDLIAPFTITELAEKFSQAYLIGLNHEEATLNLNAVLQNQELLLPLINGISMEYQKCTLIELRKLGFKGWEKYKTQFKEFKSGIISLKDIKKIKNKPTEKEPQQDSKTKKPTSIVSKDNSLKYLGFNCKSHITQEQLDTFHDSLIKKDYYWKGSQLPLNGKYLATEVPIIWRGGLGRLAYLFTRLAEVAFELPDNVSLPPNALVIETDLKPNSASYKKAELQVFSRWLNGQLVKIFRKPEGGFITRDSIREGKKNIMRPEKEDSKWMNEMEDLLAVFN